MKFIRIALIAVLGMTTAVLAPATAMAGSSVVTGVKVPPAPPALSTVSLSATTVGGGTSVTGTVRLTAAAPAGGLLVGLSATNLSGVTAVVATVPAGVTVSAGALTATFPVATFSSPTPESVMITGTAGGVSTYAIVTVVAASSAANGFLQVLPAGNGSGTVTSQPVGINCVITAGTGAGTCGTFFPTGTVVKLVSSAAAGSKFAGFRGTPGCFDPSRITISANSNIFCQGGFVTK